MSSAQQVERVLAASAGWHKEEIKAGLRMKGVTLVEIAGRAGVTRSAVSLCLAGGMRSPRIESAIARALKVKREVIWPDRYPQKDGADEVPTPNGSGEPTDAVA